LIPPLSNRVPSLGTHPRRIFAAALALAAGAVCVAAEGDSGALREVIEQNRQLQEQVRSQQQTIADLTARLAGLSQASERHERELRGLQDRVDSAAPNVAAPRGGGRDREIRLSAEMGMAFFHTGREGRFPEGEFRVDDPVIALEAPVLKNVYFFSELRLLPRETNEENFELGEIYLDFENVSAAWGRPGWLNLRAGRINIPFGEEYLVRGPLANPLISHSLADLWGVDEGVEAYGRIGPAHYVLAVQNGGVSRLRDFDADKAVTGRVGWQPARWLSVSGSAMRTGDLATADNLSELWFGNAFFRCIAPAGRAEAFRVTLAQADATARWPRGHLGLSLGAARYADSDPLADNTRRLRYGALEVVQAIAGGFFGAARYSEIRAPRGYPLAGWGTMGAFFFRPVLTTALRRTSVGLGYRFGPPLVLKFEYTWETGRLTTGARRGNEDFLGTELGVRF
jgi:hypothetical protein